MKTIEMGLKMKQRPWTLAFAMLLGVLAFIPSAMSYSGGTGEPNSPYQIVSPADWQQLMSTSTHWNKSFALIADVNLADIPLTPVGNDPNAFTGTFDGNGHTISNAHVIAPSQDNVGLFGYVGTSGSIHDVHLDSASASGNSYVGTLVGYTGGPVSNCSASGSAFGLSDLGGLIGHTNATSVTDCLADVSVSGRIYSSGVGGLLGSSEGCSISGCGAVGSVYGGGDLKLGGYDAGGLIGYSHLDSIGGCFSTGAVSVGPDYRYIGGLIGGLEASSVIDSYSWSSVTCSSFGSARAVGGLVGLSNGTISNCYSTGQVVTLPLTMNVGGLVGGATTSATVSNSFWDRYTSGRSTSAGGTGKTTVEMKQIATFTGWDFLGETANGTADTWRMCADGVDYPKLTWEYVKTGDFACPNGHGMDDLARLAQDWLLTYSAPLSGADANGDSAVTFADFAILANGWIQ